MLTLWASCIMFCYRWLVLDTPADQQAWESMDLIYVLYTIIHTHTHTHTHTDRPSGSHSCNHCKVIAYIIGGKQNCSKQAHGHFSSELYVEKKRAQKNCKFWQHLPTGTLVIFGIFCTVYTRIMFAIDHLLAGATIPADLVTCSGGSHHTGESSYLFWREPPYRQI